MFTNRPRAFAIAAARLTLSPRTARWVGAAVLLAFATFAWRVVPPVVRGARGNFLAFSDFFAQWSFARFGRWEGAARIYEADALHQFQLTLEPALRQSFPFPYPPSYLFAIWPLGYLSYGVAYIAWDAVTLALFVWAVFGNHLRTRSLWFVLLAPVTIITLIQGQNGLLTSALLVAGMRLMRARPIWGGILLGLATIKPQIGVLVPVALAAAGCWRTMAAASLTTLLLVLATAAAFGSGIWLYWAEAAAGHAAYLDVSVGNYLKPGVMANLVPFGVPLAAAHAIQAVLAAAVAGIVFVCFRRGVSDLSLAALQTGTFLAMPYVFRYDMPMLANAALLLVRDRERAGRPPPPLDAAIVILGMLAPAITAVTTRFFYVSGLSLLLLFGLAAWRALTEPRALPKR